MRYGWAMSDGKAEVLRDGNPQPVQVNKTFVVGDIGDNAREVPHDAGCKGGSAETLVCPWVETVRRRGLSKRMMKSWMRRSADRGGILPLEFKREQNMSVRLRLRRAQPAVAAATIGKVDLRTNENCRVWMAMP